MNAEEQIFNASFAERFRKIVLRLALLSGLLSGLLLLLVACIPAGPSTNDSADPAETNSPQTSAVTREPLAAGAVDQALFRDVSVAAGVAVAARQGNEKLIGQAWGDYDRDGWPDLYVTDSAGPNTLFHNNGDGTFVVSDHSAALSLPDAESSGVVFADYDNDGWPDLYVLNWGANVLYHNDGGAGFTAVTATAGVGDTGHGKSAAWGDYDQDGYLDLYVANWSCYPDCGRPTTGDRDRLYHNNGDGTFTDASNLLSGKTMGAGFAVSFTDFDNDGDPDIYLVNDEFINPVGNALWRNDGSGCDGWCFTDVSLEAGANQRVMGMGLATADYDNDGDMDLYFSNSGPMTLLQNLGDGTFADVSTDTGADLGRELVGWGAVFFDYNNDGWRDLYLAVSDRTSGEDPRDVLLRADGEGGFTEIMDSGLDTTGRTLGVAYADYDRDGWVDLVVGNYNQGYVLYRNAGIAGNHRLVLDLIGGGPANRDAIGARVTVTTVDGRTQTQEVQSGSSLGAGNALTLYFGLGTSAAANVTVTWPDGLTESFPALAADQHYTLVYPE